MAVGWPKEEVGLKAAWNSASLLMCWTLIVRVAFGRKEGEALVG